MDFYWAGLIFWLSIGLSLFLFIWGLGTKSWKALLLSGITFLPSSLYFAGAENGFKLLVLMPFISFVVSYFIRKRSK